MILSAILLCSVVLYVGVYGWIDYQRLMADFNRSAEQVEYAFRAEQDSTEMRMLQIATFVANDPRVQHLFLQGKRAVAAEGGGAGGRLADSVRNSLFEIVRHSRDALAVQFDFRHLHFHLGPGSLSFLRVHCPEKFGDQLDKVRYMVVAANAELKPVSGFETGTTISGIRGVIPVFAVDGMTQKKVHVGALEAGTSFSNMLSLFHKNRPWLNATVLLDLECLQASIWPGFMDKLVKKQPVIGGFCVEGTSSPLIEKFLVRNDFAKILQLPGSYLLHDGEVCYNITSFPLRDFRGELDPDVPAVGLVIIWRDVSSKIAAYYKHLRNSLIFPGILLFVVIEILLFYGLRIVTRQLQSELKRTRKLKAVSGKAAQVAGNIDETVKKRRLQRVLHEQMNDAVTETDAGLGMFISSAKGRNCYRVLAVSDIIWSNTAGEKKYQQALQFMKREGFFSFKLKNNQLTQMLQTQHTVVLNDKDCQILIGTFLPEGHPEINNMLVVPVVAGEHRLGALVLANRKGGFGTNEQIIVKAYAAAVALIMHADLREVARLAAEESSRLKTEFLSNMSHELRTPMNVIMGFGQLLGDSTLDRCQQGYIDRINLSSKVLLNLIDEILMIAELDVQATVELASEDFNPGQLIKCIAENFAGKAKDQRVDLSVDLSAGLPSRVNGYPLQLEQILNNLLGNAVKFGHGGGVILSLELLGRDDDTATLKFSVTDQGIGISAEQQQLIFQSFRQGDGSKTREYGGTGLGLTIAQKLCQQLGCDIVVESTLGQGSRFSFQLKVKTLAVVSDDSLPVVDPTTTHLEAAAAATGRLGAFAEIDQLLQQLEDPLAKLQPAPCQAIARALKHKQWPDNLHEDIEKLTRLIEQYRFVDAQKVVARLKEAL